MTLKLGVGLVSVAEAAARADIHPASMRRVVKEGRVAGQKIGRDWWVEETSLQAYRPVRKPRRSKS